MSSSISSLSPIVAYATIVKNEQTQVARMLKTDPSEQRAVAGFQSQSAAIATPTDLLLAKNQAALSVVLGANAMSSSAGETGLLRQLLTQDPSASNSLVRSLGSTSDLHFVKDMSGRATVGFGFGDPKASSFTASGSNASEISFKNLSWSSSNAQLTAAQPAQSWSYLLDDGTGAASIAQALTTALQATGTTADPVTASYQVGSNGSITGSAEAPALTTTTDSAGNTVYSITLASDASGKPIRIADVVGVAVQAPADQGDGSTDSLTTSAAVPLLTKALTATGFATVTSADNSAFQIVNPVDNGTLSLSPQSFTAYVTTSTRAVVSGQTVLSLGSAARALTAGTVLLSGGSAVGTVKSVDPLGNVTLTSGAAIALDAGAQIDQAIGAGVSNIGTTLTASNGAPTTTNLISLGTIAAGLAPGQTITDDGTVVGIVKSVDPAGNVTLQSNLAVAVTAGDTLGVVPSVTNSTTPGLQDQSNQASILNQYETNLYETQEDKQTPGIADALYFSRTMPGIASIDQLMSDPRLLTVVTTVLGIAGTYGELDFTQQQSILNSQLKLSSLSSTAQIQNYAERYLALSSLNASTGSTSDPALQILTGNTDSDGSDADADSNPGDGLLSALYPGSGLNSNGLDGILGALYA